MNNNAVFTYKMDEISDLVSGVSRRVRPFVETNGAFDEEKARKLADEIAGDYRTSQKFTKRQFLDGYEFRFSEHIPFRVPIRRLYTYLAISICYFFECNPDLELKFRWLGARQKYSFAGIIEMAGHECYGFDTYLKYKLYIDGRPVEDLMRECDKYWEYTGDNNEEYRKMYYDKYLADLQYYEAVWTQFGEGENGENDFIKLMYILCNAIQRNGTLPSAGAFALFPEKLPEGTPKPDDSDYGYFPDYDYIYVEEPEEGSDELPYMEPAFDPEKEKIRLSRENENCIREMEKYIHSFPAPQAFLDTYWDFRSYYIDFVERNDFYDFAETHVRNYLFQNNLNILSDEPAFDDVFYALYSLARKVEAYNAAPQMRKGEE